MMLPPQTDEQRERNERLRALVKASVETFAKLPAEEQNRILREQGESWARAEVAASKLVKKTTMPDGSIVYDDYMSYVLD